MPGWRRDRDTAGQPRSARPRDELGRLLPRGAAGAAGVPELVRELWRGLAQIAWGLRHAQRGNPVGAERLLRRAADRVEGYAAEPLLRINAAGVVAWARAGGLD